MKNINKIIMLFVGLLFITSCSEKIILPQYVTVDKINSLSNGMTKKNVASKMKIAPFDAYHSLQSGCELYSYKYVLQDQKIDPEFKNRKEGLSGNREHYTQPKDVYVYFENDKLVDIITDLGLKVNSDFEDFGNLLESSCSGPVSGCTDLSALNFNEAATKDDGTCEYCPCDFKKNPDYDPIRNCGEKCIPVNNSSSAGSDGGINDDDCSICDIVKNAGANTTINVSTVAPWSTNNSSKLTNNTSSSKVKKSSSQKKLDKLTKSLEKSKAKDEKKGKVSKKTKILQRAVDKLTNK